LMTCFVSAQCGQVMATMNSFYQQHGKAQCPILLGGGIPFLPSPAVRRRLTRVRHQAYPGGMVLLEYEVQKNE
jgi:hypothetical protein